MLCTLFAIFLGISLVYYIILFLGIILEDIEYETKAHLVVSLLPLGYIAYKLYAIYKELP